VQLNYSNYKKPLKNKPTTTNLQLCQQTTEKLHANLLSIFADMIQSQKHARNSNSAGEFMKRDLCREAINKNQLSIYLDVTAMQTISKRAATA
jgi:hypothetical protein